MPDLSTIPFLLFQIAIMLAVVWMFVTVRGHLRARKQIRDLKAKTLELKCEEVRVLAGQPCAACGGARWVQSYAYVERKPEEIDAARTRPCFFCNSDGAIELDFNRLAPLRTPSLFSYKRYDDQQGRPIPSPLSYPEPPPERLRFPKAPPPEVTSKQRGSFCYACYKRLERLREVYVELDKAASQCGGLVPSGKFDEIDRLDRELIECRDCDSYTGKLQRPPDCGGESR